MNCCYNNLITVAEIDLKIITTNGEQTAGSQYCQSKLANILFSNELSEKLKGIEIIL